MLANYHTHTNLFPLKIITISRNEIIHGGYIPALIAPSVVLTTSALTDAAISLPILIMLYIIPLMVYSFDYYKDMDKDLDTNTDRAAYYKAKSKIYPYMLAGYLLILSILVIFFTNWQMIAFISFLILVSLLYPLGLKRLTKVFPAFKNMFTIFIWAIAGTFSLAIINNLEITVAYILIFMFYYLKLLPNTFFFDMKDIKSDAKEKLKTIPVILGKKNAIRLMYLLNIVAFIPLFIGVWLKIFPIYTVLMVVFLFYSIYYIRTPLKKSDEKINQKFFILADIEFFFWPLIIFAGKLLLF
jgi:4-hydroxybenzoate polyprenyltransferase